MASLTWTPIHAQLHQTCRDRHLIHPGEKILIAVSGGQDSVCLAKLLVDLQPKWQWELAIAHCDHQWRDDSAANALHVQQLADSWQLPYVQYTAPSPPTSEAAARDWRYTCFATTAQHAGYTVVVTGHTASDRAETLLYNLIRGSGMDGLQALTWQRSLRAGVRLIRPLLELTRSQTAQFCQELALPIWEDQTNRDRRYQRNRIRLDLLPYLQTHFNPQVERTLAQTAAILNAEVDYLEQVTHQLYAQTVEALPDTSLQINRLRLVTAPLALQRRVIRQTLRGLLPCEPGFEHIEKTVALLNAPNRAQTDPFPGGAIARVDGNWIKFIHGSSNA